MMRPRLVLLALLALVAGSPLAAQQEDTIAASRARLESVTLVGDLVADFSPEAALRETDSRLALRDVVVGARGRVGDRLTARVDLRARDARDLDVPAAYLETPLPFLAAVARVGRMPVAFGIDAARERYMLEFPEYPRIVAEFFGPSGARGTGISASIGRLPWLPLGVSGAITDRFGERVDSLIAPEPADQAIGGITASGRVTWGWNGARFGRGGLGFSSISGKHAQPVACVYEGTIGPVPCPFGINAANTRLTVLGGDAHIALRMFDARVEFMRLVVGATDLPVFENDRFAPVYAGVSGTYDGAYAVVRGRLSSRFAIAGRGEWLQNPSVRGLDDGWAGGLLEWAPSAAARVYASWEHRLAGETTRAFLAPDERDARDRIVLRAVMRLDARTPR
jgi:hypothetical protein